MFSEARASSLVEGFENASPAQVPWASPCCPSVYIRVIRGSMFPLLCISARIASSAGPFAVRVGDVFSESCASSIVKGFENSAPAWPAKRCPAATSVSSVLFDSVAPTPSAFGPTFGCSFSHLPQCSIVVDSSTSDSCPFVANPEK